jgi:SAM-dependent methyltransferase
VGNIYEPRFPAENFDAIFAHQALQHLRRPVDALRQFRALLTSGGVVGVRDVDWGSTTFQDAAKAETRFNLALVVAPQQQAKSWELRAAMSTARLWRDQGKREEARELLAPVYGWFTEGFNTRDLKEAKALLEGLAA